MHSKRFFDVLLDQYRFRPEEFEPTSYLISRGLPGLIVEVQQDRRPSADANLRTLLSLLAVAHLGLPVHFDLDQVIAVGIDAGIHRKIDPTVTVLRIHEFGIKGANHLEKDNSSMARKSGASLLTQTLAAAQKGGTSLNLVCIWSIWI